jgi:hypothetical protein
MMIDNWYWVLGIGHWVLVFSEQSNIDQRLPAGRQDF